LAAQSQSALIQVRIDENIKHKADVLFADLGLDTPTAIRIFLNQAIRRDGMPFEVAKPKYKAETLAALLDEMKIEHRVYDSFDDILAEVHAELEAEKPGEVQN
jgi:DNA-damage-inducible protein J